MLVGFPPDRTIRNGSVLTRPMTGKDVRWLLPVRTVPTRENSYGGCGCAGGEVTTVRDERGRRRKFTNDVLGRLKQVDELNWDQECLRNHSLCLQRAESTDEQQSGGPEGGPSSMTVTGASGRRRHQSRV